MKEARAYVNGSYGNGYYSFSVVILDGETLIAHCSGKHPDKYGSKSVAGKVYAAIVAMQWMATIGLRHNYTDLVIIYDYIGIEKWADGTWSATKPVSAYYKNVVYDKMRYCYPIHFEKVKANSGVYWNEETERIARAELEVA